MKLLEIDLSQVLSGSFWKHIGGSKRKNIKGMKNFNRSACLKKVENLFFTFFKIKWQENI